ncbi:hypothetical protein EVAR_75228_1 [Eumeta japonica]|uniref:Uncharacterized protein n=1 Tax=Eumeta variegata TaxID=151549 RepID=A0A4C1V8X9_EUMVA|nr:hypothetical protein EVAR_75228_1 [Eumeta japonica]
MNDTARSHPQKFKYDLAPIVCTSAQLHKSIPTYNQVDVRKHSCTAKPLQNEEFPGQFRAGPINYGLRKRRAAAPPPAASAHARTFLITLFTLRLDGRRFFQYRRRYRKTSPPSPPARRPRRRRRLRASSAKTNREGPTYHETNFTTRSIFIARYYGARGHRANR